MGEKTIDARGLACPQPVLLTRKAMLEEQTDRIEVFVDGDVPSENVQRLARSQGWSAQVERVGEGIQLSLHRTEPTNEPLDPPTNASTDTRTDARTGGSTDASTEVNMREVHKGESRASSAVAGFEPSSPDRKKRVVVFVTSRLLGEGDRELGEILMRAFIKTLKELDTVPSDLIFANSGVQLAAEGSILIEDLQTLENMGVEIRSCGTCLDYYGLVDALRVGSATNMYEIATSLAQADRVLKP